ncbi:hypothetical protein EBU71_21335, partial [bacterium]|nr:hypothetical protein [Candidatus Elulimicrobium humile]
MIDNLYRFKSKEIRSLELANKMVVWSALGGYTWIMDNFLGSDEVFLPFDQTSKWVEMNHMASWVYGTLGQPSLEKNPMSVTDYFFTRNQFQPNFYSAMKDYWGISYTLYFAKYYDKTLNDIQRAREQIEDHFMDKLYNDQFPIDIQSKATIPFILHRCWLTANKELSIDQLMNIYQTYWILKNSFEKWMFYFWTNRDSNIPETIHFLRKHCPEIVIRAVNQEDVPYGWEIYDAFFKEGRYSNANDILRMNLLYKYGGLYMDIGVNILYDITALIIPYQNIFIFYDGILDTGICGAPAKDLLIKRWLDFIHNREYKKMDRKMFKTPEQQMPLTGCHIMMTFLDIEFNDRKILFLQDGFYIKLKRMGSWQSAIWKSRIDMTRLPNVNYQFINYGTNTPI